MTITSGEVVAAAVAVVCVASRKPARALQGVATVVEHPLDHTHEERQPTNSTGRSLIPIDLEAGGQFFSICHCHSTLR